jgi:uncharacterized protein (TIGR03083 family)
VKLPLDPLQYLPYLERAMADFERVLTTADLDAPVVACGDWRLRELGAHLGNVHRWTGAIVATGERCREEFAPEPGADLAEWYAAGAASLLATLREADPASRCWHFAGADKVKAFWFRRQTHEVAVHLFDARRAAGIEQDIDPLIAADGVDEVLAAMLPRVRRWHETPPLPEPLLLQASDTGHAWLLRPADGDGESPAVQPTNGTDGAPAVTAEASAEDLLLLMWKRRALDETDLRITGGETVAKAFLTAPLTP